MINFITTSNMITCVRAIAKFLSPSVNHSLTIMEGFAKLKRCKYKMHLFDEPI